MPMPANEAKPLVQIASGGELSRVMLALKSLIAGNDRVDLLVFDEIDAGIGGETALLVARKLKQLAMTAGDRHHSLAADRIIC